VTAIEWGAVLCVCGCLAGCIVLAVILIREKE
jgi:hypothetical protein